MKLTENIVFLRVSFSLPGQPRKVAADATAEDQQIEKTRLSASAKLFTGKAFAAIKAADGEIKTRLSMLTIRSQNTFKGTFILPRRLLGKATELLDAAQSRRSDLAVDFLAGDYDQERERARVELGTAFSDEFYPPADQAVKRFGMQWSIFAIDVPGSYRGMRGRNSTLLQFERAAPRKADHRSCDQANRRPVWQCRVCEVFCEVNQQQGPLWRNPERPIA